MSMINDALKRAKEAQEKAPPPSAGPELKPADPVQRAERGVGLVLPVFLALVALVGLFFLWQVRQRNSIRNPQPVETKTETPANTVSEPASKSVPPVQTVAVAVPQTTTPPPAPKALPPATAVVSPPMASAPAAPPKEITKPTPAPVPAPVPVAMPAMKLQAISFIPGSSSALVNGKMLNVGSLLSGFRVTSISQTTVTLVNGRQTNVLTLEQ